jgi:hypothetical protein
VAEAWLLRGFQERLDEWIDLEHPEDWLRVIVVNWVLSRIDDPYVGMRREGGFANLWFGVIPGTGDFAEGVAVVCSLWIEEAEHQVRCDRIATLSWPI